MAFHMLQSAGLENLADALPHLIALALSIIAAAISIRRMLVSRRGGEEVEGV